MNAVADGQLGQASGTYNTVRQLGGVFGTALAVAVFSGAGGYASPAAFTDGFTAALALMAALAVTYQRSGPVAPASSASG